jgi:hypothetical protein
MAQRTQEQRIYSNGPRDLCKEGYQTQGRDVPEERAGEDCQLGRISEGYEGDQA